MYINTDRSADFLLLNILFCLAHVIMTIEFIQEIMGVHFILNKYFKNLSIVL